jgi:hypothetical protein
VRIEGESSLVSFDAETATERAHDVAGDALNTVVEYRGDEWQALFVASETVEKYGGLEETYDVTDELHRSLRLDLQERELYSDLLVDVGNLRAFVLVFDDLTVIRYTMGQEGLYVALEPEANVRRVIAALRPVLSDAE